MNLLMQLVDVILHLDHYLQSIIDQYGVVSYIILFCVIFAETGFVITPFLPGDSLIFAAGAFAGLGLFDFRIIFLLLIGAAVLGDTVNYEIGRHIGRRILAKESNRFIKKEYIEKTNEYYEKYGGKTIVIARFIPIVRTFAPFVAGVGSMTYKKFISYNVMGGALWVSLIVSLGYFFGNIPIVANNFTFVAVGIIFISLLPALYEVGKKYKKVPE